MAQRYNGDQLQNNHATAPRPAAPRPAARRQPLATRVLSCLLAALLVVTMNPIADYPGSLSAFAVPTENNATGGGLSMRTPPRS